MSRFLFTSESVGAGHPDKIADQISDAILDACLKEDPHSRVACECMVTQGLVFLAGEITTTAQVMYQQIVRRVIEKIGYNRNELGFDAKSCGIIVSINKQSPDIAQGVNRSDKEIGAGDQGLMFGFACDETPELMPLPIMMSHQIVRHLKQLKDENKIAYLRPDSKAQVTIEYDEDYTPKRVHTVVISVQHDENVTQERIQEDMKAVVAHIAPKGLLDENTLYYINPTGRFVIGGPQGDCGLTGRKIIVDTYGGMGHHGGGCFSGKDPTKVDRTGAYAARYIAKNIIAAGLGRRCEVQIAYAIGLANPISIKVDLFGTGTVKERLLERVIPLIFELKPKGMIEMLDLQRPIYEATAFGGHFGRNEPTFTWEKTDKVEAIHRAIKQESFTSV